jgi:hypothetical protein
MLIIKFDVFRRSTINPPLFDGLLKSMIVDVSCIFLINIGIILFKVKIKYDTSPPKCKTTAVRRFLFALNINYLP